MWTLSVFKIHGSHLLCSFFIWQKAEFMSQTTHLVTLCYPHSVCFPPVGSFDVPFQTMPLQQRSDLGWTQKPVESRSHKYLYSPLASDLEAARPFMPWCEELSKEHVGKLEKSLNASPKDDSGGREGVLEKLCSECAVKSERLVSLSVTGRGGDRGRRMVTLDTRIFSHFGLKKNKLCWLQYVR